MNYIINDCVDPFYNMAMDEYLLGCGDLKEPVFLLWRNRPSVIIGQNQNPFTEVDLGYAAGRGIELVRRVTGGGAVYHDLQNLNYSIVGNLGDMDAEACVEMVASALLRLGVPVAVSGRNDMVVDGKKCSGFAKRISGMRLLLHGTLMFKVDLETLSRVLGVPGSKFSSSGIASVRSRVANLSDWLPQIPSILDFRDKLHGQLRLYGGQGREIVLPEGALSSVRAMADRKFRTWEWNFGKTPATSYSRREKFACGTVELSYDLKGACLSAVHFGGDFLGLKSPQKLAAALEGCRLSEEALVEALGKERPSDYFDSMTIGEFTALFGL